MIDYGLIGVSFFGWWSVEGSCAETREIESSATECGIVFVYVCVSLSVTLALVLVTFHFVFRI